MQWFTMKTISAFVLLSLALFATGCSDSKQPASATAGGVISATAPAAHARRERIGKGDIQFVEGYQQGYNQALAEGKPMLVFFTAEWCQFCHQMAEEAFTDEQAVALSERFVCILVDADSENEICELFQVRSFPTIQFLSPKGSQLNRVVGKKPTHQLLMAMQTALQNVARRTEAAGETQLR